MNVVGYGQEHLMEGSGRNGSALYRYWNIDIMELNFTFQKIIVKI
ncbi:hypothetical protein HNQ56_001525 [Anaerotaenia torta]